MADFALGRLRGLIDAIALGYRTSSREAAAVPAVRRRAVRTTLVEEFDPACRQVGLWHIADHVLASVKVRYGRLLSGYLARRASGVGAKQTSSWRFFSDRFAAASSHSLRPQCWAGLDVQLRVSC
jgi:hypothetical protein